jgi:hypothetical protein
MFLRSCALDLQALCPAIYIENHLRWSEEFVRGENGKVGLSSCRQHGQLGMQLSLQPHAVSIPASCFPRASRFPAFELLNGRHLGIEN